MQNTSLVPISSKYRSIYALSGIWEFAFDRENCGRRLGWHQEFPRETERMQVPGVWELVRPNYDGVGWYRRKFRIDAVESETIARLRFNAVQYRAEVWLNGQYLGLHDGGSLPFEFILREGVLRVGANRENELIVRVINPPMDREIENLRCGAPLNQSNIPIGKAGWYYNFGGIWQEVELQITRRLAIVHAVVEPWPSRQQAIAKVEVFSSAAEALEIDLLCEICGWHDAAPVPAKVAHRWTVQPGINFLSLPLAFPQCRRWTLADPFLYEAHFAVAGCDAVSVRFGMREFTAHRGTFRLNDQRVVLKGFLHQGAWPRTLAMPENRHIAEQELKMVKAAGFNFVRAHLRPAPPAWLDLADEVGLLVMAEPPIGWIAASPETEARCWAEIEGLLRRDANHPSIIAWCLMNEVFHLKGFTPEDAHRMTEEWLHKLRKIDSTRLVIDVSGGHGKYAIGGVDTMLPDTARQRLTARLQLPAADPQEPAQTLSIVDAHIYHAFPYTDDVWQRMRTTGRGGDVFFVSEFGAPPVPPDFDEVLANYDRTDHEIGLEDVRLHSDFLASLQGHVATLPVLRALFGHGAMGIKTWISACNRLRAEEMQLVTEALRSNPRLAGFCFCQLADASGELFGALDFWRRPKPLWSVLAEASSEARLGVFAWPRVIAPGQSLGVDLQWLRDGRTAPAKLANWSLELRDASSAVVARWTSLAKKTTLRRSLLRTSWPVPNDAAAGHWTFIASGRLVCGEMLAGERRIFIAAGGASEPGEAGMIALENNRGGQVLAGTLHRLRVAKTMLFSNNFREAELPIFWDMRSFPPDRNQAKEKLGQLRKTLQVGGCAVLFEPEMQMLQHLLLNGSVVRPEAMMRPVVYAAPHPVFEGLGLPTGGLADFVWASVLPEKYDLVADLTSLGATVLLGAMSPHMWTRPAVFFHGAGLYQIPVGKGTLIVCHLRLLARLEERDPIAERLLTNLVRFAQAEVARVGRIDVVPLLSRCIDPFQPA